MASVIKNMTQVDEVQIRSHVDEVVRQSVEVTLNGLLEAEAAPLCRASRYERSPDRVDTRPIRTSESSTRRRAGGR